MSSTGVEELAKKHALALLDAPHTIEIENLDQDDINARFFRFGTDPAMMVKPVRMSSGGYLDLKPNPFFRKL